MITSTVAQSHAVCAQCGLTSHAGALDQAALAASAATLAALADPIRLGIVELLSRHERMCVCDIVTAFDVGQPTVSHHLRVLREAGVVDVIRRGPWAYYGLRRDTLKRAAQDLVRLL
ncbi:MAG: metalloregulator ArsR/SmtB family transcription factor [Armatimonadota bacterium]|nr:metalloregulator ArsR/SmtB family transcription factor [Armatimonadota bacterium]